MSAFSFLRSGKHKYHFSSPERRYVFCKNIPMKNCLQIKATPAYNIVNYGLTYFELSTKLLLALRQVIRNETTTFLFFFLVQNWNKSTQPHLVSIIRMNRAILPVQPYAYMLCTSIALSFTLLVQGSVEFNKTAKVKTVPSICINISFVSVRKSNIKIRVKN